MLASESARGKKQEDLAKMIGLRVVNVAPYDVAECRISAEDPPSQTDDLADSDEDSICYSIFSS